ncbi:DUF1652 domain-containing protein [Phytopseudomonas flavescens]|nr:DUF1652 domain-containing protein [Pseudomonas flavescens]
MSILEQRQIIESAFLPLHCHCKIDANDSVTIEIKDSHSGQVQLIVAGLKRSNLDSSRSISQLVLEVRQHLQEGSHANKRTTA